MVLKIDLRVVPLLILEASDFVNSIIVAPQQQSWICTGCGAVAVFFSDSFESKTCFSSGGRSSPDCSTVAHGVRESRRFAYFTCKKAKLPFGSQRTGVFYNVTFAETRNFPLKLQLFSATSFPAS